MLVSDAKRRILYIEGEPRWEFKFIRRAEEDDPTVQLVSMLRTSENKIYRQGISDPGELADGFPVRPEDLFGYSGIIIGSVDADYFTPLQQELLREYVDRRGGGVLFLGGRSSLSDGGWGASSTERSAADLSAGGHATTSIATPATVELTAEGVDSPITRLLDDPDKERRALEEADLSGRLSGCRLAQARRYCAWLRLNVGPSQVAAADHAELRPWPHCHSGDRRHMALADERSARRSVARSLLAAAFALAGGRVAGSRYRVDAVARMLMDEGHVQLTAQVRDRQFQPAADAHVTAHIVGPEGANALIDLAPSQDTPGLYQAEWTAEKPGPYLAEITAESAGKQPQDIGQRRADLPARGRRR